MEVQQASQITVHYNEMFQENYFLKEKLENFKLVIKQCNEELTREKVKNGGVETVTKLLQETQQELKKTFKQKRALEAAVRNLQNRLATNRLPNDISLSENDVYIASLSPQTLENLARENVRLKNLLHQSTSNEDIKDLNKTQDIIEEQNNKISSLLIEKEKLQAEIHKIQESVEQHQSEQTEARENLNIDYLDDVQAVIRNFSNQCQDLDVKLNQVKHENRRKKSVNGNNTRMETVAVQDNSPEIQELKAENMKQKKRLEEVSSMNMRWQEYNKQRECHIQDLTAKISELQSSSIQQIPTDINDTLRDAIEKLKHCEYEKNRAIEETSELKSLLEQFQNSLEEKEAAIKDLKEQLRNLSSKTTDQDTVSVLMAQIQICAEDFENERRDRARAQAELTDVKAQLEHSKREAERFRVMYRTKCNPPVYGGHRSSEENQLSARGHREREELVTDGPGSLNLKDYEFVDHANVDRFKSLPVSTGRTNAVLCCPKCGRDFAEGDKLLSHIESCVE